MPAGFLSRIQVEVGKIEKIPMRQRDNVSQRHITQTVEVIGGNIQRKTMSRFVVEYRHHKASINGPPFEAKHSQH